MGVKRVEARLLFPKRALGKGAWNGTLSKE